jgi:hypothetical protein
MPNNISRVAKSMTNIACVRKLDPSRYAPRGSRTRRFKDDVDSAYSRDKTPSSACVDSARIR